MQNRNAVRRKPNAVLTLSLTGALSAQLDGAALELPPSKKARALLAYLAVTRQPLRREHLASLLWNETDAGREGLRWNLSRLRKALELDGIVRLVADRETVALDASHVDCDIWTLQKIAATTPAQASMADLIAAASLVQGDFLEGLDMPDCYEFRLWCMAERENMRRVQAAILATLCDRLGATEQALPYARRRVLLEPTEEAAHIALLRMLIALGRLPEAESHVETAQRQFRTAGLPPPHRMIRQWAAHRGAHQPAADDAMDRAARQRIHFCTTSDGVRIAYAISGKGPRVVRAANWYSHLEYELGNPVWQYLIDTLTQGRELVRYDRRGCGLSDRSTKALSFDDSLLDLEAVTGLLDPEPFDLVGFCSGGAMAISYAARHPERVRRLILIGTTSLGWRKRGNNQATSEHMVALTRHGWGLDNPAFRQLFTSLMFPEATPEQAAWLNDLQRVSATPETAATLMDSFGDYDVSAMLPLVRCPTLVLHSRDDAMVSVDLGRQCAAAIPQAQFITLPSRNHLILENEPAWPMLKAEIEAFLAR